MKELFRVSFEKIKQNKEVWALSIVTYALIMTIGISLSYLLEMINILLFVFVICPFIFSFINISKKSLLDEQIEYKDIYSGYSELSLSTSIVFKKFIIPIILSFILYLIALIFFIVFYFLFINFELLEQLINFTSSGANNIQIQNYLLTNEKFVNDMNICNNISIIIPILFFNIFTNKKIITFNFIKRIKSLRINYDYIIGNKKELSKYKLFLFNIVLSLPYIIGIIISSIINLTLINIITNQFILSTICVFVFFIISSIALPFKYISYTYLYNKEFTTETNLLLEETKN